ncbi:MAG: peptidoglycan endopeptidase [Chlamydiae bacterium]|nr:peptidoglycan endopeptidase [Chlamydiota bacterium]
MEFNRFATAKTYTPILNTPNFTQIFGGKDGSTLPLDEQGLLRCIEMVAFPKTKFQLLKNCGNFIYLATTNEYPSPVYIDCRFLTPCSSREPKRHIILPSISVIIRELEKLIGTPYIWGGNYYLGIPELVDFYPPKKQLNEEILNIWTLKGLDCSGLLYQVTNGFTPRNTSELLSFGTSIPISGLEPREIVPLLLPLDMIVWKGHMILVLTPKETIESLATSKKVILSNLTQRLSEVIEIHKKTPSDEWKDSTSFIIKRWHPDRLF